MKRCPLCRKIYADETLNFCLDDGAELLGFLSDFSPTLVFQSTALGESPTESFQTKTASIAVLPFANMSSETENEYFCDGLAEELSNGLAKIENLKVAARTSVFESIVHCLISIHSKNLVIN